MYKKSKKLLIKNIKLFIRNKIYKFKKIDPRRFWKYEEVNPSPYNLETFCKNKYKKIGITFGLETRDSIVLPPNNLIKINKKLFKNIEGIRVGITHNFETGNKSLLEIKKGKTLFRSIHSIPKSEWFDVIIPCKRNSQDITISNKSNKDIIISAPALIQKPSHKESQNIIVIVLDSLTNKIVDKDFSKNSKIVPNIYKFFENSHRYVNSFSIAEWTLPSIYSMLSGKYPLEHGYFDLKQNTPNDWNKKENILPVILKKKGYQTFACSTSKVFNPAFGSHSGFDRFFYDIYPHSGRNIHTIIGRAIEQLESNKKGKNFCFLHIIDTHEPWTSRTISENCELMDNIEGAPMEEFINLKSGVGDSKGEPYFDNESINTITKKHAVRIKNVDLYLSLFFNYLENNNFLKNTNIILTGDHGTSYTAGKRPLLNKDRTNVPLFIRKPYCSKKIVKDLLNTGLDFKNIINSIVCDSNNETEEFENKKIYIPNPKRDFIISESLFGIRYKICIRDKNLEMHRVFPYDKKTKKIAYKKPITTTIFDSENKIINRKDYSKFSKITYFNEILIKHLTEKKYI